LHADATLARLLAAFPRAGRVEWIGVRPARHVPPEALGEVLATDGGLLGDHYGGGKREVTLIQAEHLPAIASLVGAPRVDPALVRRNLVVSGLNLVALKDRRFRVGEAVLQYTGACHPCSRMEDALGAGGYNAMRGHGGITARVLERGTIRQGDPVIALV
jgi:MOSC domain-containing protein YiiM